MASTKTKRPGFIKRHKVLTSLLLLLGLIVLSIPAYFIYEKVALELNRRAFTKARQAIDVAYASITAQLGQPYAHTSTNTCSKGYNGPFTEVISCSVDIDFKYRVLSQQASDALDQKIVSIISASKDLKATTSPEKNTVTNLAPGAKPDTSVHWYKVTGGLLCAYRHVYWNDSLTTSLLHLHLNQDDFYVTFGCSSQARAEYYTE